jgi:hypothetical protein
MSMSSRRIGGVFLPMLMLLAACQASPPPAGQVEPAGGASAGGASAGGASAGGGGVSSHPPTPLRTATSGSSELGVVHAGLAANGTSIVVHVGQRLVVDLADHWTAPAARAREASVTAPLQPLRRGLAQGFPVPGPASATFTAVRVGWALVTAETDYACLHAVPACALPQQSFTITVKVLPSPGKGAGPPPVPAPS